MKVLFVASEASPFIKTGGLGDVMGALPPALKRLGLDVKVVLPKYKNMKYEFQQKLQFIKWFTVKVGWRNQYCGVSQCEYNGVTYYFLDNEYYFGRDGLYGFYDDAERFAFFDRAVMKFIKEIDVQHVDLPPDNPHVLRYTGRLFSWGNNLQEKIKQFIRFAGKKPVLPDQKPAKK